MNHTIPAVDDNDRLTVLDKRAVLGPGFGERALATLDEPSDEEPGAGSRDCDEKGP